MCVHRGKLGGRSPALCLFHKALQLATEIVDALREIAEHAGPAQRTLTFRACSRRSALHILRLMLVPAREELKVMNNRLAGF